MQVLTSTDHNIHGSEAMAADITTVVTHALRHVSDHVTRVEVHLADENGPKAGANDMRCTLEGRIEGRQPIAITHHADTIPAAVHGAASKLASKIESILGRAEGLQRAERA